MQTTTMPRWLGMAFLVLVASAVIGVAQTGPMHLNYGVEVRATDPGSYFFHLEITNPGVGPGGDALRLVMPFWAPGAYRPMTASVRAGELAVQGFRGFEAIDETGAPRSVTPDGERAWKVDVKGARRLTFRYVHAEPAKRPNNRSYLAEDSGLIDGPRSWVYVDGMKHLPCHVHFRLPEGWKVGTGLDPTFDPFVFHADDYDRLADCPTAVGLMHEWGFQVRGVPHRVVAVTGKRAPEFDAEAFVAVVKKIVETHVAIFDDVPYQHYSFIYTSGVDGGLEHLTSTTIGVGPSHTLNARGAMGVTAHEHFHAWNVKRLRPKALGPFDYTQPVRVKDLWICEGITSYYTTLGLWRAELHSDEAFLRSYERNIDSFQRNPAHLVVSPEDASWTVWDRNRGFAMDYYLQGEVLGLMIDLAIRDGSDNRKGFDDVMRKLYRSYGGYYRHQPPLPGFESDDVPRVIREETGVDLDDFWNRHIRRAEDVPWNRYLEAAGWHIETTERVMTALSSGRRFERSEGGVLVRVEDGDALARAGFQDGDLVKKVGERDIRTTRNLSDAFNAAEIGAKLAVVVQRGADPTTLTVEVEPANELSGLGLEEREGRVLVSGVRAGSGIAEAGIRRGDRILEFGGKPVTNSEALREAFQAIKVSATAAFLIERDGAKKELGFEVRARRDVSVGKLASVPNPTPRQLAIRAGLKAGTANGIGP